MKYQQPSFQVGGVSESFDEGYERTFGKERQRNQGKRYVYRETAPGQVESFEIGEDFVPTNRDQGLKSDYEKYGKLQATDGTPIDSKTKHRNYMKERGLAMADDYKGAWEKAEQKRADAFTGRSNSKSIRESIERAWYKKTGY